MQKVRKQNEWQIVYMILIPVSEVVQNAGLRMLVMNVLFVIA